MSVTTRYAHVRESLDRVCQECGRPAEEVLLLSVSKTVDVDAVAQAVEQGAAAFGENRPDELVRKAAAFPQVAWHFIGNIQSRRIKDIVPAADLIHSVCKRDHLPKISHAAREAGKVQRILIEANVSGEESKSGLPPDEVLEAVLEAAALPGVEPCGLMTMAPQGDADVARRTFHDLRQLRDRVREQAAKRGVDVPLSELSMGMSEDWPEAVAEGSTIIRIGRAVFDPSFDG